ncbi:hypothetical protein [Aquimarina agarivorans]|uniref:hypothetical protein n=1 Tax=Aquimarina agarivorans TaxID=980584 RepID=UPI000248E84E|nr:hypothetical protein [Aquimarina agarivorans]
MNLSLKKSKEFPKLFSVLLDQFFMSITTLLISVILARVFDKTDYADLVLLFSVALFTLGFQSALISRPYAINLNDITDPESTSFYNFNVLFKLLFTFLLVSVAPVIYYLFFDETYDLKKMGLFLLYVVAHTTFYFVRETMLSERKTKQNLYYGLSCAFGLIATLIVIFYFKIKEVTFFLVSFSSIYLLVSFFILFLTGAEYLSKYKT